MRNVKGGIRTLRAKGQLRKTGECRISLILREPTFELVKRLATMHDRSIGAEARELLEREAARLA